MTAKPSSLCLKAGYYVDPETFHVHRDVALFIEGNRIVARRKRSEASADTSRVFDYGDAALLPAFVNCHAHLDLSHLRDQPLDGSDFAAWLGAVARARKAPTDLIVTGAEWAIRDMLAFGTAAVMDILSSGAAAREVARALGNSCLRALIAVEVIGPTEEGAGLVFDEAVALAERVRDDLIPACGESAKHYAERLRDGPRLPAVGFSPHAPYTVTPALYRRIGEYTAQHAMLQTTHLAESPAEREFCTHGTGTLRDILGMFLNPEAIRAPGAEPVALWAEHMEPKVRRGVNDMMLVHCYDLRDDEVALLGKRGAAIAYCPRSRAFFGHPPFRFADLRRAGVRVCMGTDSLASGTNLNMLDEIRQARADLPGTPLSELFRAATIEGRLALMGEGTLDLADLMVLAPGKEPKGPDRLLEALVEHPARVLATFIDGKLVAHHV